MALGDLTDWMDEFGRPGFVWFAKRLSGNDTLANKTHQAGPYIPKEILFDVLPDLHRDDMENPDVWFELYLDSHSDVRSVRAVWYNNKLSGGTRNETRITNFGGGGSALLDPDSTGTLAVFVFKLATEAEAPCCHVWVCGAEGTEADLVEERLGPVEPGSHVIWRPGVTLLQADLFAKPPRSSCWMQPHEIPQDWLLNFPTGRQIIEKAIELRPDQRLDVDRRLMRRRACEYEIFRSVEEASWLPKIRAGFTSIDQFLGLANTILQSRKSRAGKSLEYHADEIFREEGLRAGTDFEVNAIIEGNKRPDFLFPSAAAYHDASFDARRLRMLAAKTTVKDRWRQILNEADRIKVKHLLTLQEGVSEPQFREMTEAGVRLVVPQGLHPKYPDAVRPHLVTLEGFIGDLRIALHSQGPSN